MKFHALSSTTAKFFYSWFQFVVFLVALGFIYRAAVAFYLGLWSFSDPETIRSTLKPFFYGWHFDLSIGAVIGFVLFSAVLSLKHNTKNLKAMNIVRFLLLWAYLICVAIDALYAKESGRHISYELKALSSVDSEMLGLAVRYSPLIIIALGFTYFLNKKITPHIAPAPNGIIKRASSWFLILIFSIICFRGFSQLPQDASWAYQAGGGPQGAVIALNGGYGMFWALVAGQDTFKENIAVPDDIDTKKVFTEWQKGRGIKSPIGKFDGNIVIVFLEGWPGTLIDKVEDGVEVWPFFNKLRKNSLHTELFLAGGHRTTEGLFASLCSYPNPLGKSVMYSDIEGKDFTCIPRLLSERGYTSAFFQGSEQFTSGVGLMALKAGFQKSYGKREIPGFEKMEQSHWGVFDTDLYKFVINKMNEMPEPLFIGINSNTTHDNMFPTAANLEKYKSVYQWADFELEEFYNQLTARSWKKDWLLILVADHTSYSNTGIIGNYSIPFLMKYHSVSGPQKTEGKNSTESFIQNKLLTGVYSQLDLAPTIADLTGTSAPHFLGRSLLRPDEFTSGASAYHLGESAWFDHDWAVTFNIRNKERKSCFQWKADPQFTAEKECPKIHPSLYESGISFLKESQELLFE